MNKDQFAYLNERIIEQDKTIKYLIETIKVCHDAIRKTGEHDGGVIYKWLFDAMEKSEEVIKQLPRSDE